MKKELPFFIAAVGLIVVCGAILTTKYFLIAPAIPLGIVGFLALYRFPELGLLTLAFLVPLEGLFAGNKLFTGAKLIGIALIAIVSLKLLRREIPFSNIRTPLWWPIIFLIFAFGMSSAWSPYPELSSNSFRQLLTAISVFYITLGIKDRVNLIHLMRGIVVSVAITAFLALVSGKHTVEDRAIGLLTDPNYFALLLTTAVPFAIYLLLFERNLVVRLFWGTLLLVTLMAFQKTLSRSGMVVLALVLLTLGWHHKEKLKALSAAQIGLFLISSCLAALIALTVMPQEYRDRILSLANLSSGVQSFEDRSLGRRTSYIVVGLNVFKDNPILGSGPGTFPVHYAKTGFATAFSVNSDDPELFRRAHNTYLETLAETGSLGFLSLCAMVWMGLMQYKKARDNEIKFAHFDQATLIAHSGAAFLAISLFFLFLTGINNKYYWILLALSSSFMQQSKLALSVHLQSKTSDSIQNSTLTPARAKAHD